MDWSKSEKRCKKCLDFKVNGKCSRPRGRPRQEWDEWMLLRNIMRGMDVVEKHEYFVGQWVVQRRCSRPSKVETVIMENNQATPASKGNMADKQWVVVLVGSFLN